MDNFLKYRVSGFLKVPDVQYYITDSALAGMAKYFHTSMLYVVALI